MPDPVARFGPLVSPLVEKLPAMFVTEQEWFYFPPGDQPAHLVVRLGGQKGVSGWGDCPCPWPQPQVARHCRGLQGLLAGYNPAQVEELHVVLAHLPPEVRTALESALWDLLARSLDVPLHVFWGGLFRSRIPLAVQVAWTPEDDTPQRFWPLLHEWHSHGFRTLLVAPAHAAGRETWQQFLTACREWEPSVQLLVDASGVGAEELLPWLDEVHRAGITGVIDPARAEKAIEKRWATTSPVPVWASAWIESPHRAWELLSSQAVHALALDPFRLGGWLRLRECVSVAAAAGAPVTLDLRRAWQPTLALGCHLAASTLSLARPLWTSARSWQSLPEQTPLRPGADAMLAVPRVCGSGAEPDRRALDAHLVS